jgi:hypothetical protein
VDISRFVIQLMSATLRHKPLVQKVIGCKDTRLFSTLCSLLDKHGNKRSKPIPAPQESALVSADPSGAAE